MLLALVATVRSDNSAAVAELRRCAVDQAQERIEYLRSLSIALGGLSPAESTELAELRAVVARYTV